MILNIWIAIRLAILRIDIKSVTFLHLILDYQFKNLRSRVSIIKISDMKCDIKIIVNLISITEISRSQTDSFGLHVNNQQHNRVQCCRLQIHSTWLQGQLPDDLDVVPFQCWVRMLVDSFVWIHQDFRGRWK